MILLHEIIRTVPGQEELYMASVLSLSQRPGRDATGYNHRHVGQFRTAETSGPWPAVVNLWDYGWQSLAAALARQFGDADRDTDMEDWWNRSLHLRRGGFDRILVPGASSSDPAGLAAAGVRGRVFLHEILWLPLGAVPGYLAALEERFLPLARRFHWQLVGAWRVAMRPRQAVVLFAFREWADLARLLEARESDPGLRAWFDYRDRLVQDLEELVLLPGRMNPLGIRD